MIDNYIQDVFIITFCKNKNLSYGTTLVFDTIRLSFPNSNIYVIDNGIIIKSVKDLVIEKTKEIGGEFISPKNFYSHDIVLRDIVKNMSGSIAVVDPDIIFWDRFDSIPDSLISGRKIPTFYDPISACINYERIHTSLLKIKNCRSLFQMVGDIESEFEECDLFKPIMFNRQGIWERMDTMSNLSSAFSSNVLPFNEEDLNKYDHLFCGTHIDVVKNKLKNKKINTEWEKIFFDIHDYVNNKNYDKIKGVWKIQEDFFNFYRVLN